MAEQPWDARRAGADLVAAVTAVIAAERTAAAAKGQTSLDVELARAVLRCPALHDANKALMDALMVEYELKIAATIGADAAQIVAGAEPAIRAQVAEEIALAIEQQSTCDPAEDCGDTDCLQLHADAATARRIGGAS